MTTITLTPGIILGLLSLGLFISIGLFLWAVTKLHESRQNQDNLRRAERNRKNCNWDQMEVEGKHVNENQ